jgi:hypothetical protein
LSLGFVDAIHAQEDRVRRVNVRLRATGTGIDVHGATKRLIRSVDAAETEVRVCQRGQGGYVRGIELHGAFQRPRRRSESLRVLMESPEKRPGLRVARLCVDCALQVRQCVRCRAARGEHARKKFQDERVVTPIADDSAQMRGRRLEILQLERDQPQQVTRLDIVWMPGYQSFE